MKLLLISALLSVCSGCLFGDQIVMKNGDRITGTIVKKDGDNLSIKSEQFGTITTSWAKVDSIKSDSPVTVVVQGKTIQGTVNTTDGKIAIASQGATTTAAPADVTAIRNADEEKAYERLQHPKWDQLWAGNATLGFAGSAGNAITMTFTTGVTAARTTNTDKTSVYFNDIRASAFVNGKDSETAQAIRGGISYDHNVTRRLFLSVSNDWESDKFQDLNLRYVIGGGAGYHLIKGKRNLFDILAGGDYNHANFSTPSIEKVGEFYFGDTYSFKMNSNTSITQSMRVFDDLAQSDNFRANFDLGISTKLMRWLTWNISFSDRYLNDPAPGRKTNDILYTTGVGITFAH